MINRNKSDRIIVNLGLVFVMLIFGCGKSFSQQTIINIPSSEMLPAGDIIFKQSTRFDAFHGDDNFVTLTPTATMGLGHGIEISAGAGTTLDSEATVKGAFSAKKVFFMGKSTRFTVGGTISPYFSENRSPDSFMFAHVTQRIKETKTSLTAGGYVGGRNCFADSGGVIFGVEQVIIRNKLRVALDWASGENSNGRFGVGLKYRPTPTLSITSAVIIPNKDSDNIAFNISVSKFISLDDENPIKRRLKNVD